MQHMYIPVINAYLCTKFLMVPSISCTTSAAFAFSSEALVTVNDWPWWISHCINTFLFFLPPSSFWERSDTGHPTSLPVSRCTNNTSESPNLTCGSPIISFPSFLLEVAAVVGIGVEDCFERKGYVNGIHTHLHAHMLIYTHTYIAVCHGCNSQD